MPAQPREDSAIGRPPWGYTTVRADGVTELMPTTEGRTWVPRIFTMITEGMSAARVAEVLDQNRVRSHAPSGRWHETTIVKMIHRETYSGQRARSGRDPLGVEPLVSRELWDKAQAALAARARGGGAGNGKSLLTKVNCGHPDCPGDGSWPMYRVKNRQGHLYYRCAGRSPQRKGCGAPLIPMADLDNLVLNFASYWDTHPYVIQRFIPGNEAGERLEALRAEMAEAVRAAPTDKMPAVLAGYSERIEALEAEGAILPHWEAEETGETAGQHLRSLDPEGQRDYLAHRDIKAWKDAGGAIHVTVDGVTTQDRSIVGSEVHPEAE